MTPFFPGGAEALAARLAAPRTLLAFDFDGTLAPLVSDRTQATMRASTRGLLAELARLAPTVIITGRARADCLARLDDVPVRAVVGNHGLEEGLDAPFPASELDEARAQLSALIARADGLELEDKRFSLSVHYRADQPALAVHSAVRHLVRKLATPMRLVLGHRVVNVVPATAPHKGDALRRLMAQAEAEFALYVGDDVTDEDAFSAEGPERLASIRIGAISDMTHARFSLGDQRAVDELLLWLVRLRE